MSDISAVNRSRSTQTRLVLPPDTNHLESIFGGKVLAYIDEIAAIAAMKHANSIVVTASIDSVDFVSAAKVGNILELEAFVTATGRTSMEVYVKVQSIDVTTGTTALTTESFLTMVAVNENGDPIPVPGVSPETEEEQRLFDSAPARKEHRKKRASVYNNHA